MAQKWMMGHLKMQMYNLFQCIFVQIEGVWEDLLLHYLPLSSEQQFFRWENPQKYNNAILIWIVKIWEIKCA